MREHGAGGAFSAIFIDVVELATFVGGLTLPFDWYALIARTPRLEPPLDASGAGVGCGATSARPYCARRASDCAIFSSPRLAGLAPSARLAGRALLFASSSACSCTAWSRLCASFLLGRSGIEHRTLRCCDFHSVLFVPSTLRVSGGAASLALGRAIPQWIATWA